MSKSSTNRPVKYAQPTLASEPVEVDPDAKGTPIRWALGVEALLNIVGGTWMVFWPAQFLRLVVPKPSDVTPAAMISVQHYGGLVYALTVPIILAIPNTRRAIESRISTYYLLGSAEIAIICLSLYQAYGPAGGTGFTTNSLASASAGVAPVFLWRLFVLFRKPEWLGRYREKLKGS